MKSDTIFPTYNARHYAPKEVAETFIWSESFSKLIQNNHSVILGARGCGKTTLMKMLTLPALNSWESERAENIRRNIPFYAIYISTDIYWDVKNHTYNEQLKKFGNFSEIISRFSVNTNVFMSLCDTFLNVLEFEINNVSEEKEFELGKVLISAWKLPLTIPKIKYIKEELTKRVDDVNQMIQNIIFNYNKGDDLPHYDYFNLSFVTSIESIIPIFERIFKIKNNKKWALCFDELEFAPIWLQSELFVSLRSRKHYILYKLSASPILSSDLENCLKGTYRATTGNDYELIKMWNSSDNKEFSIALITSLLKKKYPNASPYSYFESNEIYNKESDSYEKGSDFYKQMLDLIRKDESFKTFLKQKKVKTTNPTPINEGQKDTLFRKIKPIVYYRNFFIESNKTSKGKLIVKYRSRKSNNFLSGIEILSEICDGNPRWLIGLTNSILIKSDMKNAKATTQYKELYLIAQKFKNVINNIPVGENNKLSIMDIVDKIGLYFRSEILGNQFKMDPKGTFIVDEKESLIPNHILDLIEKGISQGAFILLDTNDDAFDFEIRNQRIKLSYLFFVLYDLPIRKYGEISLSRCLKGTDLSNINQMSLFE
ncbi:ORC-CDC6 family AAA ATPase [Formosa sp. 3Alg 14/1]|uniref:ORC-CDC6 family AAA ATPase n=1 Tax=Formosa sp. 3Alg 14/1 TaxID=3382190 RepID=UPI0039BE52A0